MEGYPNLFGYKRVRQNSRSILYNLIKKGAKMQTAKQEVSDLLNRLPDNCTLEDVQYHLYVLQKIEQGLKDVEEGRVYTQEEIEKKMSKWLER